MPQASTSVSAPFSPIIVDHRLSDIFPPCTVGHINSKGRANTSVHPAWNEGRGILSFGVNWNDTASENEKKALKEQLVHISRQWDEIAGPEGGTYLNEANP